MALNDGEEVKGVENDDKSDDECPVCFEPLMSEGEHRICTLKCGHIFGRSCIERWLTGRASKHGVCPKCKSRANRRDIINLYLTKLRAIDNSNIEKIQNELKEERSLRLQTEAKIEAAIRKNSMLVTEIGMLKNENSNLEKRLCILRNEKMPYTSSERPYGSYSYEKSFDLNKGGCRLMTVHPNNKLIIIAKESNNQLLFPGYGICKLNAETIGQKDNCVEFLRLHSGLIRDMCLNPFEPSMLLSCSLDKTLKITSLVTSNLVAQFNVSRQMWSCHWDVKNSNYIYCGSTGGTVSWYDIRNTDDELACIQLRNCYLKQDTIYNRSPVVSICPIALSSHSESISGLMISSFNGVYYFDSCNQDEAIASMVLCPQGSIIYAKTDPTREYFTIFQRPASGSKKSIHLVGKLVKVIPDETSTNLNNIGVDILSNFSWESECELMTRSCIFSPDSGDMCVAFSDQKTSTVNVWNVTTGVCSSIKSRYGPVRDIAPLWTNNWHYLVALTSSNCSLHKYVV